MLNGDFQFMLKQAEQDWILKCKRAAKLKRILSIADHAIALKTDGTVITCGNNEDRQRNLGNVENAIAVSCAGYHSVILTNNGAVGAYGAFLADDNRIATSGWSHMIDITCGPCDTAGITQDGHVRSCGLGIYPHTARWSGITMIAVGFTFMLGLKDDGTVLSCESNEAIYYNQSKNIKIDTSNWDHIIDISSGCEHAVGLKNDGTVVACGKNDHGQCNVASWNNIISVSCGSYHTLGLQADGTIIACGNNKNGQCNVSNWKNVVGLAGCMGRDSSAATCADGTVLICGDTSETAEAANWKLFNNIDTYEDECRIAREERTRLLRQQNGLCIHCGGRFKGLFRKQCSICGIAKDY